MFKRHLIYFYFQPVTHTFQNTRMTISAVKMLPVVILGVLCEIHTEKGKTF